MLLKDFKSTNVHLTSLTLEKRRKVLWVMYEDPFYKNKESDIEERYEYTINFNKYNRIIYFVINIVKTHLYLIAKRVD